MLVENIAKALTKLEEPNHCREAQLPTAKKLFKIQAPLQTLGPSYLVWALVETF